MDFHSLSRRELQVLCKRNGIQANMTNAAMADALAALGELQEEGEEDRQYLSPKKAEAGSPEPPKTGRRTSTRLSSRRAAAPPQGSPLPRSRRVTARPPGVLSLDGEENAPEKGVPETPRAPVPARKGVNAKEEATVGVTTRRRARQPSTGVAVGSASTRRSTRGKAAATTKMADLKSTEEEEDNDVAENVAISSGPAMEEDIGSKEPEGEENDSLKGVEMAVISFEELEVAGSEIASNGPIKNVAGDEECNKQDEEKNDIVEATDEFSENREQELKEEGNVQAEEPTVENSKKDQNGEGGGEGKEEEQGGGGEESGGDDDGDYEEVTYEFLEESKEPVEEEEEVVAAVVEEEVEAKNSGDPVLLLPSPDSDCNKKEEEERVTITLTKAELDSISLRKLKAMYKDTLVTNNIKMKEGEEKKKRRGPL